MKKEGAEEKEEVEKEEVEKKEVNKKEEVEAVMGIQYNQRRS